MMLKKFGSLLAVAAALGFAGAAQAEVILADFEVDVPTAANSSTAGNASAWSDDGGSGPPPTQPTLSTFANAAVATHGTRALQINPVPGSKNFFLFNIADSTGAFKSAIQANRKLLADFTYHGSQMNGTIYANVEKISVQTVGNGYWYEVNPVSNPSVEWQTAAAPNGVFQFTREYDLSGVVWDADPWTSIVFSINYDRAAVGAGAHPRFWVDNIRVIPEPATIGLATVGLAGLGMLRRRRR
jgi:PEP-CTERM motif